MALIGDTRNLGRGFRNNLRNANDQTFSHEKHQENRMG